MTASGKGYTYVVTSTILVGGIYNLGKVTMEVVSTEFLIAWMFTIASLVLGIWTLVSGRWRQILKCSRRDWINILAFSGLSIFALQTFWLGVKHLDPTVAAFISRLQTLVSVFLGVLFLKERFGRLEAIGGLLLIAGVIVIRFSFGVGFNIWFWLMVASGVTFGVTEIFAKQSVGALHPIPLNFVRNSILALFFMVTLVVQQQPVFEFQGMFYPVLTIAVMGPLLSRLSFLYALSHIEVSKAALVNQLQPIFVALIAFTALGMIPSGREWIGGVLILSGSVALMGGRREKKSAT